MFRQHRIVIHVLGPASALVSDEHQPTVYWVNPTVRTLAEADGELQRLTLLKKNHLDEQYVARRSVRDLPGTVADLTERLKNLTADEATATAHAADRITMGNRAWSRDDTPGALTEQLDHVLKNVRETTRVPLGVYLGLRFGMVLHPQWSPEVYLEGESTRRDTLSRAIMDPVRSSTPRTPGPRLPIRMRARGQNLAIAEAQLRDYQARLAKPFAHEEYMSELTCLRDRFKARLSATAQDDDTREAVSEVAARIKEITPQRAQRKKAAAEEPVTARIRRRQEANPEAGEAIRTAAAPAIEAANDNHQIQKADARFRPGKGVTGEETIVPSFPPPNPSFLPSLCSAGKARKKPQPHVAQNCQRRQPPFRRPRTGLKPEQPGNCRKLLSHRFCPLARQGYIVGKDDSNACQQQVFFDLAPCMASVGPGAP